MLREIINQFYLDREKGKKEQTSFYISQAGKCPRQVFFKFKNAPAKEKEARILRLFDHGDHMHQLIMRPLLSTRAIHVIAAEVDIPPGQLVRGRADAIISDGKEPYVLDIKTMNSMIFRSLEKPKEDNVDQIQLYLHYFNIKNGILLYVDKDRLELKEFVVPYDPARVKPLLDGLEKLKNQIEKNIVPPRISTYPSDWQCKYCDFREICDMARQGEMEWEEFKKTIRAKEPKEQK